MKTIWATHQGDVLVEKIDKLPKGVKEGTLDQFGRGIVAEGEVTGHLHAIHGRKMNFYVSDNPLVFYASVPEGGTLNHETAPNNLTGEHGPQKLEPGDYRFTRQTEAPWGEADRMVAD
jgi:hypothetical protein